MAGPPAGEGEPPRGRGTRSRGRASLGSRKAAVLRAVVRDHIRSAEPVGSGTVAVRYRLGVSPATIRNDMAALTELGYLVQPHTSAGRIPTDLGYRFYVDTLPPRGRLTEAQRRAIIEFLGDPIGDVEEVLRRTAQLLSRITRYAAVALAPVLEESRVVRAELVPLGSAALLLVVSDTGRVDRRVLDVPDDADDAAVRRVSEMLVRRIGSVPHAQAGRVAEDLAAEAAGPDAALLESAAEAFRNLAADPGAEHLFMGGVANIAGEEIFERRETFRRMFEALEEGGAVLRLLRALPGEREDVTVRIGRENPLLAMREASLVVAPYRAAGRPVGTIAVIGPTRMEYPMAISSVRAVARRLTEVVDALAG